MEESGQEETYTVTEAAKILKMTPRGVRNWAESGKIEATQDAENGHCSIPKRAVHARLEEQRDLLASSQSPLETPESAAELLRVVASLDLQYRLGRSEARLEITEKAESTLSEQLERERSRAEQIGEVVSL